MIGQHLFRRRLDIEFARRRAQRLHQRPGIGLGVIRGREPRHRISQNAVARQTEQIERLGTDQQRLGGVQAAGNPDHHLLQSGGANPLRQPGDLDVVGLVTILLQPSDIRRHERKALDPATEADIAGGRRHGEADAPERARVAAAVGIERPHLQAFLCQHIEVDIGDRRLVRHGKPFGLGQSVAVLEHRGLAVPGKVGGRFARPRPRRTDTPPGTARTATGTADGGSPPCRW